jgi:predicted RND superfamily exporter protein
MQPAEAETATFVGALAGSWVKALRDLDGPLRVGEEVPDLTALGASDPSRLGYYYLPDETNRSRYIMLVRVYHREDYTSLTAISETVEAIRAAVREASGPFGGEFRVGVTGRPALEADEMRTSDTDSRRAEIVALIAVFVGMAVMLRSAWLALAGVIALCVGIGWTFGWATVSVGELNLLSIVFLLALIGIGMDYLVQVMARYREQAARRTNPHGIWIAVFRQVAAPINTACTGAAGAFLVAVLTKFRGAAELGIIAGGGLLLCLIAGYVVLPAVLTIFPPRLARRRGEREGATDRSRPAARASGRILLLPVAWIVLLAVASPFAFRTGFDANLINLQAPHLESVKLVRKLETWSYAILSKDLAALRRARDAVRPSPLVERTESVLAAYDNYAWLKAHESELPKVAWARPETVGAGDLGRLRGAASALAEKYKGFGGAAAALGEFARLLDEKGGGDAIRVAGRLSAWQEAFVRELEKAVAPFHPDGPPDLEKLPRELKSHYVAEDGTYALYVYPQEDLWDRHHLATFVKEIESRMAGVKGGDLVVTGIVPDVYYTTSSIERSFYRATAYALGLIVLLVLIDLRSVTQTLLAVSVLALGLPMLVSINGLLGVDWNFANFFGLPILIGAGHEYGVFLVHRYREAVEDPRRVWRRWDVADRGLLLCAYITCTSFGFFWAIAHHRGLRSLGLVMAVGTACIYLAGMVALRPILLWRLGRRARRAADSGGAIGDSVRSAS